MSPQPWILRPQVEPTAALRAAVGGHPLVAQLLAQREIDTPERALPFLDSAAYAPAPPNALVGLERAAHALFDAICEDKNFLVWGDFDVDGQTSTTLLVAALQELAAPQRVRFHVPNRFSEGHGIQPWKLRELLEDASFEPQVLLTCDTGIAEGEGIGIAKDAGLTVVVTDHHDLPAEFADAEAGAAPCCAEPADRRWRPQRAAGGRDRQPQVPTHGRSAAHAARGGRRLQIGATAIRIGRRPRMVRRKFLDLVALGIVADVAEQRHDTRYLLQVGLDETAQDRTDSV